jgi:hypothetical protein
MIRGEIEAAPEARRTRFSLTDEALKSRRRCTLKMQRSQQFAREPSRYLMPDLDARSKRS